MTCLNQIGSQRTNGCHTDIHNILFNSAIRQDDVCNAGFGFTIDDDILSPDWQAKVRKGAKNGKQYNQVPHLTT